MNYAEMDAKLKNTLREDRYVHSKGVEATAVELAQSLGADVEKARIAGLLHDLAKNMDREQSADIIAGLGVDDEPFEKAVEDPPLPENPDQNSDPDCGDSAQEQSTELERLRAELKHLRNELSLKDARLEQISTEFEEFNTLYPDTPLSSLQDSVWADVRRGIPIAAAYALEKRRQEYTARAAAFSNAQNASRSAGALTPTESDYFSPAEVRAMSQSEVRANYQKIIQSMQKWR